MRDVRDFDELTSRLRALLAGSGLSYRDLHQRVVRSRERRGVPELPAYNTVYRCLRPGRSRLDVELVVDIARVLAGEDAALEWRHAYEVVAGTATDASVVSTTNALPEDIAEFTGRKVELDRVLAIATRSGGAVAISAIEGMAGLGKTRLAIHAAHELRAQGRFGDLQLSANLRGYDPDRAPADPAAVLDSFLRHLGVSGSRIQGWSLAQRTARFEELLSGRRALIVLDNAANEEQVRPLLPNSPTCFVLVTSRRRLEGLPVTHVPLDLFGRDDSVEFLRRVAGADRIDSDPESAVRIAELLGHLPLALAVVASRIQATPDWTLVDHLARLTDHRERLRLDDGVELALALSYEQLPAEQRQLLRLFASHPGRDLTADAAGALMDTDLETADQHLAALHSANLVQQRGAGRYELHDLVRVFATARARDEDHDRGRNVALTRLFDHYRYISVRAMRLYSSHEARLWPRIDDPGTPAPDIRDRAGAVRWLDSERANLIAVATYAADNGWPEHTVQLARVLAGYLYAASHHEEARILHTQAGRVTSGMDQARARANVGLALHGMRRHAEAEAQFRYALRVCREFGDRLAETRVRTALGGVNGGMENYQKTGDHYRRALALAREIGAAPEEARNLLNLGELYGLLGRHTDQYEHLRQAVAVAREVGDQLLESLAQRGIGRWHRHRSEYAEAIDLFERSLAVVREHRHHAGEISVSNDLGIALARSGKPAEGLEYQRRALTIACDAGDIEHEIEVRNDIGATLRGMGRLGDALEEHQTALVLAREQGLRYERARAHEGIAQVQLAKNENVAAEQHIQEANALYAELGITVGRA